MYYSLGLETTLWGVVYKWWTLVGLRQERSGEGEVAAYFLVFRCTHASRVLMAFLWSFTDTATLLSVVGVGG